MEILILQINVIFVRNIPRIMYIIKKSLGKFLLYIDEEAALIRNSGG